jgi:phage terminase large subunit-like protein
VAVAFVPHHADAAAVGMLNERYSQPAADPRIRWRQTARPEQLLPPVDGTWRVLYLSGGRGSGKTRAGAQDLADLVLGDTDGEGEYGIIAPTYADAWTKCVEGESGILRALGTSMAEVKDHRSKTVRSAWRTYGQVVLHNGIVIYIDSASEGGLRIQGRNLKAAWCDEVGLWDKWDTTWNESLRYAVRMGVSVIIATGTPKAARPAARLVRSLIRDEPQHGGVIVRRLRTVDNRKHLSEAFYRAVVGAAKGTRLEQQELEGVLLDDVPNALWERDLIELIQVPALTGPPGQQGGYLRNAVIGVDPSDGTETSDEQAYTIAGLGFGGDQHIYVVKNWGGQEAPAKFAKRVILEAVEWDASISVEKNHGGRWLTTVFAQVMKELDAEGLLPGGKHPYVHTVDASQNKRTRAEPVSALYQRKMVRHCKMVARDGFGDETYESMVELEDQMCTFTGSPKERSPDRLDSMVWALTRFLYLSGKEPEAARPQAWGADSSDPLYEAAGGLGFDPAAPSSEQMLMSRIRRPVPPEPWDIDEFAPQADPDAAASAGRAPVQAWR